MDLAGVELIDDDEVKAKRAELNKIKRFLECKHE